MSRHDADATVVGSSGNGVRRMLAVSGGRWVPARIRSLAAVIATAGAVVVVLALGVTEHIGLSAQGEQRRTLERTIAASVLVLVDGHMAGSGAFVTRDGVVLTAEHVVRSPSHVRIVDADGRESAARVLAVDRGHDVALLVADSARPRVWLPIASHAPRPGERLWLLGHPLYRHRTVTPGWVASDRTTFEYVDGRYTEALPVAGISARGASGGPWLNEQGEVVGVQAAMMSVQEKPQGLLFAAPLEAVRLLLETRRDAVAADLGMAVEELWEKPPETIRKYPPGLRGLYVAAVGNNGPAQRAGVEIGSVITAVDGNPVRFRDELLRVVRARNPGETLSLTVVPSDGGEPRVLSVTLGRLGDTATSS